MRSNIAFICLLVLAMAASAGSFTNVVVFGDSLSDNGNLYAADHNQIPSPPYYLGRVSNGLTGAEILAQKLGAPLMNYAWAGATTGVGNVNDSGRATFLGTNSWPGMWASFSDPAIQAAYAPLAPTSLFVLWGGAMDLFYQAPGDTYADSVGRAVTNIVTMTMYLQAMGAKEILVPGLPDMGLTPRVLAMGPATAAAVSGLVDALMGC